MSGSHLASHNKNNKYMCKCIIMPMNAAILTVACVMLCLTFNNTFPLHRDSSKWSLVAAYYGNRTKLYDRPLDHDKIVDRTKKTVNNIENAFKKIKESTQDIGKNIYEHINTGKCAADKNKLSEHDLRQYEQLVMMKKYPYLDLKEIELKFSPSSNKIIRQSIQFEPGPNFGADSGLCEPLEDGPNVEITNRGLSGFAIPSKVAKTVKVVEKKIKMNNLKIDTDTEANKFAKLSKKSPNQNLLVSLKNDIREYEDKKLKLVQE